MLSFKMKLLCVLAIFRLTLGESERDPADVFLSGDYDPAKLMDSLAVSLGADDVFTDKDDIADVSKDVTFWCSNQQTLKEIITTIKDSKMEMKVNLEKPFTFIVHGWHNSGNETWIKRMVSSYWMYVDTNVCVVDWNRLASYTYAHAAERNTKAVGKYIAEFIKSLVERKVSLDDVTIVGHSLGGQIAGYAGAALGGKLGAIYGLDPAGPMFTHPIMHSPNTRLDTSDAKFVQIILTTKGMLGASIPCGHQNFFPNGGTYIQPGCVTSMLTSGVTSTPLVCSHSHSTVLFRYSLNPKQSYFGTQCESKLRYNSFLCQFKPKERMGIYNARLLGDFYLTTSSDKPFLQTHQIFPSSNNFLNMISKELRK